MTPNLPLILMLLSAALGQDPSVGGGTAAPEGALTIPSDLLGDLGYFGAILGAGGGAGWAALKGIKAGAHRIGQAIENLTKSMTDFINAMVAEIKDGKPIHISMSHRHVHVIHVVQYEGDPAKAPPLGSVDLNP